MKNKQVQKKDRTGRIDNIIFIIITSLLIVGAAVLADLYDRNQESIAYAESLSIELKSAKQEISERETELALAQESYISLVQESEALLAEKEKLEKSHAELDSEFKSASSDNKKLLGEVDTLKKQLRTLK